MTPEETARLLSLISHELRAPIGVIRGYLRLLEQRAELEPAVRDAVAAALRASARAADLLSEVSTLAQLGRGDAPFELKPVALDRLLRALADEVELPGDPTLRLELGDCQEVQVMADSPRLRAALTSLATAVVRVQAQSATARIGCCQAKGKPDGCVVEISRVDRPSTDVTSQDIDIARGGLGLELPIAAAIIAAHGGRITEQRVGTACVAMVVWLPCAVSGPAGEPA
jgi:signal transduction histidine kinase